MSSSGRAARARRCAAMSGALIVASAMIGQAHAAEPMTTGGLTSQPIGHYEFCKANPTECNIRLRDSGPAQMSGALWREIVSVNMSVNAAVKPMNDYDVYGKDEVWSYPDRGVGDCEDY